MASDFYRINYKKISDIFKIGLNEAQINLRTNFRCGFIRNETVAKLLFSAMPMSKAVSQMVEGAWVKVYTLAKDDFFGVWHHGIISKIKDGEIISIIHFCSPIGNPDGINEIRETNMAWFLENGKDAQLVKTKPKFPYSVVLERARTQLGKGDYNLSTRNCQHFASHCYTGNAYSTQVLVGGTAGVVVIAFGAICAIHGFAGYPW